MTSDVKRDSEGIARFLKSSELARIIHAATQDVANQVSAAEPDAEVVVDDYTTDRVAGSVTIRDPRAQEWQARDGILTRAAAAAGLEVTTR